MLSSQKLLLNILSLMDGVNKRRKEFFTSVVLTLLCLRGRHNFLNLARYGDFCEKTYRNHYEKPFDFLGFNTLLTQRHTQAGRRVLAFDPTFIPKSGKCTAHLDWFWCSQQGRQLKGLEIGGLALIDLDSHTALHLEAIQTPGKAILKKKDWSRVDHYARCILSRADALEKLASHLVVDGFFGKSAFIDPVVEQTALHLIGKLRRDANLRYLYRGKRKKNKRGRPRCYAGKVNLKKIDKRRLRECYRDEEVALYEGVVNAKHLKRDVKVCYVEVLEKGQPSGRYQVLYSTDLDLEGLAIYQYYKARFQIEFLFRDAKQYTGLTQGESRSENKIHFHANIALSTINLAKVTHYLNREKQERGPFSMADIKTENYNMYLLDLFLSNLEISPKSKKIKTLRKTIRKLGKIAA